MLATHNLASRRAGKAEGSQPHERRDVPPGSSTISEVEYFARQDETSVVYWSVQSRRERESACEIVGRSEVERASCSGEEQKLGILGIAIDSSR